MQWLHSKRCVVKLENGYNIQCMYTVHAWGRYLYILVHGEVYTHHRPAMLTYDYRTRTGLYMYNIQCISMG